MPWGHGSWISQTITQHLEYKTLDCNLFKVISIYLFSSFISVVRLHVCMLSHVQLWDLMDCSSPSSSVHGISRQEYWSGLSFPTPGDLPYPGIEFVCLVSTALAGRFFTTVPPRYYHQLIQMRKSRLVTKYCTTGLIAFCQ